MPSVKFLISYSGPALDDGSMDVRELAPALLALGKLCEESNRVLNEQHSSVAVRVTADFKSGSFEIDLELLQTLSAQVKDLFGDFTLTDASSIWSLLFGTTGGLCALLKWLKGRQPEKATELKDGNVTLQINAEKVTVNQSVIKLYQDLIVREQAEKVVKPVEREGIEFMQIQIGDETDTEDALTITKDEVGYFTKPSVDIEDEQLSEFEAEVVFSIASLSFKEDNKWRLSDGESERYVSITDDRFLKRIENNEETFSKGDTLRVNLITRQFQGSDGSLKTEYEASRILRHDLAGPKSQQIPLFLDREDDDSGNE